MFISKLRLFLSHESEDQMNNSVELNEIYQWDKITDDNTICEKIEMLTPNEEILAYKYLKKKFNSTIITKIQNKVNIIKQNKRGKYFDELLYCLYYKKSFEQCLYVIISSAINNKIACIDDHTFHIEGVFFPKNLTGYLNVLKTNSKNPVTYELLNDLYIFSQTELINNGLIYKIPFLGNINTSKFKRYKNIIENTINTNIKNYIHNNDINELSYIDSDIINIYFHLSSTKKFKTFYADLTDATSAYLGAKSGNPRKYDSYYSMSNHKYPIKKL